MKPILIFDCRGSPCRACMAQPPKHYDITDLGVVGAPPGAPYVIRNNGLITEATAAPGGRMQAVLWYKGWIGDLGTPILGGPNSAAFGVNESGQAVGQAETSAANTEDFCGFNVDGFPLAYRMPPFRVAKRRHDRASDARRS